MGDIKVNGAFVDFPIGSGITSTPRMPSLPTKIINSLTLRRASAYALGTMLFGCIFIATLFVEKPETLVSPSDFPAFYNSGRIVNEFASSDLYDKELQAKLFADLGSLNPPPLFAYTPFFALVFSPLARLPYLPAYILWVAISLVMFVVGFRLVWSVSRLPVAYRSPALIIGLAFMPFYSWCWLVGQTSAFGLFFLALAIYLDANGRRFLSGCSLALLLYKPQLVILFGPMLIVTRRWRALLGFIVTSLFLILISLRLLGAEGTNEYFAMLGLFAKGKASNRLSMGEVDAFSFFSQLLGGRLAVVLMALLAAVVLPLLVFVWTRKPQHSWAHTISWTIVLNFYVLIHDSSLIILAVILTAGQIVRLPLSTALRWLLLILFMVPWVETYSARMFGFQPLTIVLIVFGCYQLSRELKPCLDPQLALNRIQ